MRHRFIRNLAMLACLGLLASQVAAEPKAAGQPKAAAVVNGEAISRAEIDQVTASFAVKVVTAVPPSGSEILAFGPVVVALLPSGPVITGAVSSTSATARSTTPRPTPRRPAYRRRCTCC